MKRKNQKQNGEKNLIRNLIKQNLKEEKILGFEICNSQNRLDLLLELKAKINFIKTNLHYLENELRFIFKKKIYLYFLGKLLTMYNGNNLFLIYFGLAICILKKNMQSLEGNLKKQIASVRKNQNHLRVLKILMQMQEIKIKIFLNLYKFSLSK